MLIWRPLPTKINTMVAASMATQDPGKIQVGLEKIRTWKPGEERIETPDMPSTSLQVLPLYRTFSLLCNIMLSPGALQSDRPAPLPVWTWATFYTSILFLKNGIHDTYIIRVVVKATWDHVYKMLNILPDT